MRSSDALLKKRASGIGAPPQPRHVTEAARPSARETEAVGRLAGAVAHEFNNLLTAIMGYSSLLLDSLEGNRQAISQVMAIRTAGDRATSFIQQLLALGRRQLLQPELVDLNASATDLESVLRGLSGEGIELALECEPALWPVRADPRELGRAVMALFLNAKEALPDTGTVTIQTANLRLEGEDARAQGLAPGCYAALAVRDSSAGMDAETAARIFEPFEAAQDPGHGNGLRLGLAAVRGFAEQSGGAACCASEPGLGTTFTLLLPAADAAAGNSTKHNGRPPAKSKDRETVLLVEDEDPIRNLARAILEESGYTVLEARDGREALALCESRELRIDLLVTDVVMPALGGRELAEGALQLRPGLGVVYMSGYAQNMIQKLGKGNGVTFLQKPFASDDLLRKVREGLDARPGPPGGR